LCVGVGVCGCVCVCVWGGGSVDTHACYFFVRKLQCLNRLHKVHNCEIVK